MPISAPEFAQIVNDFALSGTYGLQGLKFAAVVRIFNDYFALLKRSGKTAPQHYVKLLANFQQLVQLEEQLSSLESGAEQNNKLLEKSAALITKDTLALKQGDSLFIPGGWYAQTGGHALIYQFTRQSNAWYFSVINTGEGLQYHGTQSHRDKERYQSVQMWEIPLLQNNEELRHFITRLLQARYQPKDVRQGQPWSARVLYLETLASISYCGGQALDAREHMPAHAFTAGQFSGSCAPGSMLEMLKISSPTLEEYQQFILPFKVYVTRKFAQSCLRGKQPLTRFIAEQIQLAIENNIRIATLPELFDHSETKTLLRQLNDLQQRLLASTPEASPSPARALRSGQQLKLNKPWFSWKENADSPQQPVDETFAPLPGSGLVQTLNKFNDTMKRHAGTHYGAYLLEKCILALPIEDSDWNRVDGFYRELQSEAALNEFLKQLCRLQRHLVNLKNTLLNKNGQTPVLAVLTLSVLSLQVETYERLTREQKLPSFQRFNLWMMRTLLGNQAYNPFLATNHLKLDARLITLFNQYGTGKLSKISCKELYQYYRDLLNTEPDLFQRLNAIYADHYESSLTQLGDLRRHGLQALYLLSPDTCPWTSRTDIQKFSTLFAKINAHLAFESNIRFAINAFFQTHMKSKPHLTFGFLRNQSFYVSSPMLPQFLPHQILQNNMSDYKYNLDDGPALQALNLKTSKNSPWYGFIGPDSSNQIQLSVEHTGIITRADLLSRTWRHLRLNPALQIPMTLDYFSLHMDELSDSNCQRYVEANLFQPGVIQRALDEQKEKTWLSVMLFLKAGFLHHNQNGQFTQASLFFLRLDCLFSRYLCQIPDDKDSGMQNLRDQQLEIEKQLAQARDPQIIYVLHQYLFLNVSSRCEYGEAIEPVLTRAYLALMYLNTHENPQILEDKAHQMDVERAKAVFLSQVAKLPQDLLDELARTVFHHCFPDAQHQTGSQQLNLLKGQFFVDGRAEGAMPVHLQHHALIQHLGLPIYPCLINEDGRQLSLMDGETPVLIVKEAGKLRVYKMWEIDGLRTNWLLRSLSKEHVAYKEYPDLHEDQAQMPAILTDGSMDIWVTRDASLLTQYQQPRYLVLDQKIILLNDQGYATQSELRPLTDLQHHLLAGFEDPGFMLHIQSPGGNEVKLPRYQLVFDQLDHNRLCLRDSGEQVMDAPSPIHPLVAGLILSRQGHTRYLVPVQRVVLSLLTEERYGLYPFVHDIRHVIPTDELDTEEKNTTNRGIWDHQQSQRTVCFQLENQEPVTNIPADALYLAYLYLASKQPDKAWATLDTCNKQLGGLTGSPEELQYLSWIIDALPFILSADKEKLDEQTLDDPKRRTQPYIACQLKALSLLSDYLNQGHVFNLEQKDRPLTDSNQQRYADLVRKQSQQFLQRQTAIFYDLYTRMQAMHRHAPSAFILSKPERLSLLHYYHSLLSKDSQPVGALGAEWTQLCFDGLMDEQGALLSRAHLSPADHDRLRVIQQRIASLKTVAATFPRLDTVPIKMDLGKALTLNTSRLPASTLAFIATWTDDLPGPVKTYSEKQKAVAALNSSIRDEDFILHFPALFQLARQTTDMAASSSSSGSTDPQQLRARLRDFCRKTLIANRTIPLDQQSGNIPFLCHFLYRVVEMPMHFQEASQSLAELLTKAQSLSVTPIGVIQTVSRYENSLLTVADLQSERPHREPRRLCLTPQPDLSVLQQTGINPYLSGEYQAQLALLLKRFESCHSETATHLAALSKELTGDLEQMFAVEAQAGKVLLALERNKKALADDLLQQTALVTAIQQAAEQAQSALNTQIQQAWHAALTLANQGPDNRKQAEHWQWQRQAKARATLGRQDLLKLYCHADATPGIELTGLSLDKAFRLHQLIHQALVLGIRKQIVDLVSTKLVKSPVSVLDVLARNAIPCLDSPAMVLIQHEDNKILRRRQVSALASLLGPNENMEKITMGGGKSKVILPILAEIKASGDNLVIIEVPPGLLATNQVDMNRSSQKLFGKRAWRFEFNRSSDCSPEALERLYQHFTAIMTRRDYLVSTVESSQSLELKYLELLLQPGKHDETWTRQIYWLVKIDSLFQHHTDVIIDECHVGLSLIKKLIYPFGTSKALDPAIINAASLLFSYIDRDVIRSAPTQGDDFDWLPFRLDLARKLVNRQDSPIKSIVQDAVLRDGVAVRASLIDYLSEQNNTPCPLRHIATEEQRQLLDFLKGEINKQLPFTLVRQLNKQYGASHNKQMSPAERSLAIPYIAANVPNERNRVGIDLQAINYSSQMMLLDGISRDLFVERLLEWQMMANQELIEGKGIGCLSDTSTARRLRRLTGNPDFNLQDINVKNAAQIDNLHARYRYRQDLIIDTLRNVALKQIQQDSAILVSDCFNHVDQFRSVQAISGTPLQNQAANHIRFQINPLASLGTDDQLFDLLQEKNTPVLSADYHEPRQYLNQLFTQSVACERTRMVIDIKGTFTGVSNVQVAGEIAAFIRANPQRFNRVIQQVLYFDEDQVLSALEVTKPDNITRIGSSDEDVIKRILMLEPGERFTFYDQLHTIGADILQDPQAHAIVLIDATLGIDATFGTAKFLQGTSRPRSIAEEQSLELVVPSRLQGISLEALRQRYKQNDIRSIFSESPEAIQAQLHNLIRKELLAQIRAIPGEDAERKSALAQHFKPILVQQPSADYSSRYGGLKTAQQTDAILNHYRQQLEARWAACLQSAELQASQDDIERITRQLLCVIEQGRPFCAKTCEAQTQSVEVEQQVEVHQETEHMKLTECYDPNRYPSDVDPMPLLAGLILPGRLTPGVKMLFSLNELCGLELATDKLFSQQLLVTKNFKHTWQNQPGFLDAFSKPVFLIWYYQWQGDLLATLVTPEDADQMNKLEYFQLPNSWLASTQDTLLYGNPDINIVGCTAKRKLREQVRFYNGELHPLLQQPTPLLWLNTRTEDKLNFFETRLLRYRPASALAFRQLSHMLRNNQNEGFAYLVKHRFEDCSQLDWQDLFPDTVGFRIEEYSRLAYAFQFANQNWTELQSVDPIPQRFNLSAVCQDYLESHLQDLNTIADSMSQFHTQAEQRPFLCCLTEDQCKKLGTILNLPLQAGDQDASNNLRVLALLNAHPLLIDDRRIDDYFIWLAEHSGSSDLMFMLLDMAQDKNRLIYALLQKFHCVVHMADEHHLRRLLQAVSDPILLETLVLYKPSPAVREAALRHRLCSVDLLLKLNTPRTQMIDTLRQHPQVINDEGLESLLNAGLLADCLSIVIQHGALSRRQLRCLIEANELLECLLASNERGTPAFDGLMQQLIACPDMSKAFAEQLFHHPELLSANNKRQLTPILIEQGKRTRFIQVFESPDFRPAITDTQITAVLPILRPSQVQRIWPGLTNDQRIQAAKTQAIGALDLPDTIQQASHQQLTQLIRSPLAFNAQNMTALINAVQSNEAIHALLDRPDMTADYAQLLFAKPNFDYKLRTLMVGKTITKIRSRIVWTWMNDDLLKMIITQQQSNDYTSIKAALRQLSPAQQQASFDAMERMQRRFHAQQSASAKLNAAMYDLRVKACQKVRQDLNGNGDYHYIAGDLFELHQALRETVTTHANNRPRMVEACVSAIDSKRAVLAQPRGGIKQALLDILNVLLLFTMFCRGFDNWRLFKATTGSTQVVNDLIDVLRDENVAPGKNA